MSSFLDIPVEIVTIIVEFLDVRSALPLRLLFKRMNKIITEYVGLCSFRKRCLKSLNKYRGDKWNSFYLMNDEHLEWLLESNITELRFRETPYITDKTLKNVGKKCPNLECMVILRGSDNLRITCDKELRKLTTDGVVSMIQGCNKLRFLALSWCEYIDGDVVCEALHRNENIRNNLEMLNLNGVKLGDVGIQFIGKFPKLRSLENRDSCSKDISPLSSCPLEVLHLCRGSSIQSSSIVKSTEGFSDSIKVLCVAGNRKLETDDAKKIIKMCPHLKTFNCVRGCKTDRGELQQFCEDLGRNICLDNPGCGNYLS